MKVAPTGWPGQPEITVQQMEKVANSRANPRWTVDRRLDLCSGAESLTQARTRGSCLSAFQPFAATGWRPLVLVAHHQPYHGALLLFMAILSLFYLCT